MLTKLECEFYETMPLITANLAKEVTKLREAVEKCTGREIPSLQEEPVKEEHVKEEHPTDSAFDCLAITNVRVFPFKEGANLSNFKGCAEIVLNDQLIIRGLRVMEGENGLYVAFPNDPFYKGEDFRSIVSPITRQLREHIENCVLEKYQAVTA